jgi:hypothetical protein
VYHVPKDQFKGLSASMSAHRCSGSLDESGKDRPYIQVLVHANGSPSDKSVVLRLGANIHVYRKSSSGQLVTVKQTDTPKDELQGRRTSSVVYDTDRRWNMSHVPATVNVTLRLITNKGKPVIVRHTFHLP